MPVESAINDLVEQAQQAQASFQAYGQTNDISTLKAAVEIWQVVLADPVLEALPRPYQAAVFNDAGMAFYAHYQIASLLEDLNQAVELFGLAHALILDTRRRRASVLSNLSAALQARSVQLNSPTDLDEAVRVIQLALDLIPAEASERASYLTNLTGALFEHYARTGLLEDLDAAVHSCEAASSLTLAHSPERIARLNNLAVLLHERYGRLGEIEDLQKAIDAHRQVIAVSPENTPERATYLNNLGGALNDLYRRTGQLSDLQEAVDVLQQAVHLTPPATLNRAGFLNNLGNALSAYYLRTKDLNFLEEAITRQREAVSQAPIAQRASFLTSLGSSLSDYHLHMGASAAIDEAVKVCEQALALTPPSTPKYASRLNNLARCLRDRYKHQGYLSDLQRGRETYRRACEEGLQLQREVTLVAGYNWGLWALERSAWDEATGALNFALEAANELFFRQVLRGHREAWLHEAQSLAGLAAYAQARCHRLEAAVLTLEQGRARLLAEVLERDRMALAHLTGEEHAAVYDHLQRSVERVEHLEARELRYENAQGSTLADELRIARAELRQAIEALQAHGVLTEAAPALNLLAVQHALCPHLNRVGVYWVVTPVGGMALIVSSTALQPVWLDCTEADLERWLLGDSAGIPTGYIAAVMGNASIQRTLDSLLPELSARLVRPVVETLQFLLVPTDQSPVITFIPTGRLTLLPLHITGIGIGEQINMLSERWSVVYAPSAMALAHCRRRATASTLNTFLGVGNPLPVPEAFAPLPYAQAEVEAVAGLFGDGVKTLCNLEATRAAIESALPSNGYLHFACHGQFNLESPLDSNLILADGQRLALRNLLTSRALKQNRLVVLSACQTALTDFGRLPDEALGLPTGFLQAGAAGVIGTLWPVNDFSTALLMFKFYEYHRKVDLPPALALREAQGWLRAVTNAELSEFLIAQRHAATGPAWQAMARAKLQVYALQEPDQRPFTHPFYWAAFAFYGA